MKKSTTEVENKDIFAIKVITYVSLSGTLSAGWLYVDHGPVCRYELLSQEKGRKWVRRVGWRSFLC